MKIYFSCSITGGRRDEAAYAAIVHHLLTAGHDVLTAVLADPAIVVHDAEADPRAIYLRDIAWIREADVVIAEVSTPSHGVGYEVAYALSCEKPVLCAYRKDRPVTKMLLGNDDSRLSLFPYEQLDNLFAELDLFLRRIIPDG